ncbi:I78 family peptidase inhibitor [Pseudomonas sp. RA_35y_Pfl2_P32]|uniref:I78 family peptidase inhibitor n=1 Tax=Pseudomonas sp. RA_35y_Pfl2_P32 TaxID=3088705 RepID=UPI0030D99E1C
MTNEEVLLQLQHLIGQPYVTAVKAYIGELTARRVVGASEVATKELDSTRIHIVTNASGTIEAFRFG